MAQKTWPQPNKGSSRLRSVAIDFHLPCRKRWVMAIEPIMIVLWEAVAALPC